MPIQEKLAKAARKALDPLRTLKIPPTIASRFRLLDEAGRRELEQSLKSHFFTQADAWYSNAESYFSSEEGKKDLLDHLHQRLEYFRGNIIPWLSDARSLDGAKILEIGCGTGSSTVALAEQGASVTAVDIVESSLTVARDRCRIYKLNAEFRCTNATRVHEDFKDCNFDLIIFFATLEHMTHAERMVAMKNTWNMLKPGGLWCSIETPNRLWFFDNHTSMLPFYLWLPDDLAFSYSRLSPRERFRELYRGEMDDSSREDFLRRGRGVSFHEFDLTMKPVQELDVVSSLPIFLRDRNPLRKLAWKLKKRSRFESVLAEVGPKIHRGFYQESLDLIIRKD